MLVFKSILILIIVLCVLLVLIILAQNPKGGGLSSSIGGGDGGQMFGVQQTNKFLVNTTWGLAAAIGFIVLFSSFLIENPKANIMNTTTIEDFSDDFTDKENNESPAEKEIELPLEAK